MTTVLKVGGRLAVAAVDATLDALLAAFRFLAGSAEMTPTDDMLSTSVRGGVLNYRTDKLDDGTDPYGWYERD